MSEDLEGGSVTGWTRSPPSLFPGQSCYYATDTKFIWLSLLLSSLLPLPVWDFGHLSICTQTSNVHTVRHICQWGGHLLTCKPWQVKVHLSWNIIKPPGVARACTSLGHLQLGIFCVCVRMYFPFLFSPVIHLTRCSLAIVFGQLLMQWNSQPHNEHRARQ